MEGRAAVVSGPGEDPRLERVEVEGPREGEVLVRLAASGICGSDVHVVRGRSNAATYPVVLGHEGAGRVAAVGPGVRGLSVGDHVVLALYGPCHECRQCLLGRFPQCEGAARQQAIFGRMADGSTRIRSSDGSALHPMVGVGSLAELAVLRSAQVVAVPDDLPLDLLCLAGCGVTTGLGAVFNIAGVGPGDTVAVVGCGGVGLNVVQGSRIAGAAEVVALDIDAANLELAVALGATAVARTEGRSVHEAVFEAVPGGVDFSFEVVGEPSLVADALAATRPGGTCVMVGSPPPGATIPVDGRVLFNERRLLGCVGGSNIPARDVPRIVDLYRRGLLDLEHLVTDRWSLEETPAAVAQAAGGHSARNVVIVEE